MNTLTDRRGNTICEYTDRFTFDPPAWWDTEGDDEQRAAVAGIRGREVQIRVMVTGGEHATCRLKSNDPVMKEWLRGPYCGTMTAFPLDWLKLID